MNITEFKFKPTEEQNELIDKLLSNYFPLYYGETTKNYEGFCHSFLIRNENYNDSEGVVNSNYWEPIHKLFKEICAKHGIEHKVIYRACLNVTTYDKNKMGDLHVDHNFPHKNFVLYLNNFSDGSTYIQDDETKEIIEAKAEKFKFVIFGGHMHAQGFCGSGERRVVLVVTFN